jgi:hypothetical protein
MGENVIADGMRPNIPEDENVDLFEYLLSQPDVDVDLPLSSAKQENAVDIQAQEKTEKQLKTETVAELIRKRSGAAQLTAYSQLKDADEGMDEIIDEIIEMISSDEAYADINSIKGQKDTYFHSTQSMTGYFAAIGVDIIEKNYAYSIANMVRSRCKSKIPSFTLKHYFTQYPYFYTIEEIDQVIEIFKSDPNYADIGIIEQEDIDTALLYSTLHHSRDYILSFLLPPNLDDADDYQRWHF